MSNDTKLNPYLSRYIIFDGTNGGDVERWSDYQIMEYESTAGFIMCTSATECGDPLAIFPNTVIYDHGNYYSTSPVKPSIKPLTNVDMQMAWIEKQVRLHNAQPCTGTLADLIGALNMHIDDRIRRSKDNG